MMSVVSPGALPFTTSSLGVMATASARSALATETRWMLTGLSTISDLPTVTVNSLVTRPAVSCGGAAEGPGACSVEDSSAKTNGLHNRTDKRAMAARDLVN